MMDTVIPKTHPMFNSPILECRDLTDVCNSSRDLHTNSLKHEVRPFKAQGEVEAIRTISTD